MNGQTSKGVPLLVLMKLGARNIALIFVSSAADARSVLQLAFLLTAWRAPIP